MRPANKTRLLCPLLTCAVLGLAPVLAVPQPGAAGQDDSRERTGEIPGGLNELIERHRLQGGGGNFDAIREMTPDQQRQVVALMEEIGLTMPPMDPARGRRLFVNKGCVVCHSVNGIGGNRGPALDAATMPQPMNAFDFAARMWRGAPAMAELQDDLLAEVIALTGQDLADLVAFAHDEAEQARLTDEQIPGQLYDLIRE